ncbi:MAG: Uma2 family endonuclease [Blastocatellia bacterium]|nr:Uma2 family endonuclease [Blastocatellia bacterium]
MPESVQTVAETPPEVQEIIDRLPDTSQIYSEEPEATGLSPEVQEIINRLPDTSQAYSEEPEMESSLHYLQLLLLVTSLEWLWREQEDFFIGANLSIYFSAKQLKTRDVRGPDFFLVKNTEKRPRKSWVVWEEGGQYPDLIIELLSASTAKTDRETKKKLYQNRFRTPEYFWFSPETLEFKGFHLKDGAYKPIRPNAQGHLWSQALDLYLGVQDGKLRYFTSTGLLVPTPEEAAIQEIHRAQEAFAQAEQEAQRAQQEAQRAQQEAQRAEKLAAQLRALGIEPEA